MRFFSKWAVVGAVALFAASCSGDGPSEPGAVTVEKDPGGTTEIPGGVPQFALGEAGNGSGECLTDDVTAAGLTSGSGPLVCTANDIDIASATITEYSLTSPTTGFVTLAPGASIQCTEGQTIYARTFAEIENSAQERYDIGIWIATGTTTSALTAGGTCNHYNLITDATGVSDLDGDACGDMAAGAKGTNTTTTVPLDVLTLTCTDNGSGGVSLGACVAWQNSVGGADRVCADNSTPQEFRYGTTPETKSKCNCDPFLLPLTVNQSAKLEVVKACVPATIAGATFDLSIDGVVEATDAACGGSTGAKTVGAGTSSSPGAVHTFAEGGFTAADYTSSYACVDRVGGGARGNGTSLGPNNITLQPDDDVICTFTNTKKPSLTIIKDAVPNAAQDFAFTGTGTGMSNFDLDDDADGTLSNTKAFTQLVAGGTRTVTETPVAGYTITNIACTGATSSTVTIGAAGGFDAGDNAVSVVLAAGEDVSCTFTNTLDGSITIVKDAVPNDAQNFAFTGSGTGIDANFSLDDDADGTLPATRAFTMLQAGGSRTITETATPGWTLTNIACTGATSSTVVIGASGGFDAGDNSVTIGLALGENVSCTFTNTKHGSLTIVKDAVPNAAEDFAFTGTGTGMSNFDLDDDADGTLSNTKAFTDLLPGSRTVTEGAETEWVITGIACTGATSSTVTVGAAGGFNAGDNAVTVGLAAGEDVTCTFTNSRRPRLIVQKVVVGGGVQSFDFTRNPGSVAFSLVNGGENNSGYTLAPGTYRVCELNLAVTWTATATIDAAPATLVNPDLPEDHGNRCVDVTLAYGDSKTVVWTNNAPPPPGGDARTIGYWKNWSSCTGGNQYTKAIQRNILNKTLDYYLPTGSAIYPFGDLTGTPPLTCEQAVRLLSKSDMNTGRKAASDPAYNLAAQLLAAKLNYAAGANQCPAATAAILAGQTLLADINFIGTGNYKNMSAANASLANSLAATLDSYNNNTLCPPAP